jgi:hypothetical protein
MISNRLFSIFILGSLILYSCTEEIEMKSKSFEPQLVVGGVFTDQEREHYVDLSVTGDFFKNEESGKVTGATVSLRDATNEIQLQELDEVPGRYVIPKSYRGTYHQIYTLQISDVDIDGNGIMEEYEAAERLNPAIPIDSVALKWSTTQGQKAWQVLLFATDAADTEDYYGFTVYLNGELLTEKLSETQVTDDMFFNGRDVKNVWVQTIVEEDNEGVLTETQLKVGDWVKLEMQVISKEYYDFIYAVYQETGFQIPLFSGPPANVPTNVSNGAVGFFRVYSLAQDSIQVTQEIINQRTK